MSKLLELVRAQVASDFNSPAVLEIQMGSPVIHVPRWCARPHEVLRCVTCGTEGTLASPVGWVCGCVGEPVLQATGRVEWS